MANYLGYGLKAGVEGFQSGFNMAQQKQEMEWQKKKKKELEEKELRIKEGAALYNSLVKQVYADNVASEDEMMKLNTAFLAAGYEVQAVIKDSHNAIQTMDKNKIEQDLAWLDLFVDLTEGLDPKDTQGTFDMIKGNVKSEKGLNLFEAFGDLQKKRYEVTQKEKELEVTKYLPEEYQYPHLKEAGIVGEITPTETTKAPTFSEKRFNWKIEQYNQGRITLNQLLESEGIPMSPEEAKGLEKQVKDIRTEGERAGIDPAEINKAIRDKILGKEAGTLTPTAPSVENVREDIKNAPTIEDAKRMEKNHIAKYGDTLDIPNVDKFWSDERVRRLTSLKQGIDKLLDENKRLRKGSITSAEVGFDIEDDIQKVEAVYQRLREEYMKYRKKLEEMGVDLSQFPELMSYEEYTKTDIKPKVIYDPRTWGGQKPSVY